jgi:hypothetical protein
MKNSSPKQPHRHRRKAYLKHLGLTKNHNPKEKKERPTLTRVRAFREDRPPRKLIQKFIKIYNEAGEQVLVQVPIKFDFNNGAWRSLFFQTLVEFNGNVSEVCKQLKIPRIYLRNFRNRDLEFEKEFQQYLDETVDYAEDELKRRGVKGFKKGIYYRGRRVAFEMEYSDTCLTRYLAAHRAAYRTSGLEVGGKGGEPVPIKMDHDVSERLLNDPTFNQLAHALLERVANDPGRDGQQSKPGTLDPDAPPDKA